MQPTRPKRIVTVRTMVAACLLAVLCTRAAGGEDFVRLKYNHPGLAVDLGVGLWAWPLPMDFDGDGDLDLVVSCSDVPYNGTYFFENPGTPSAKWPVFKPAVRIDKGWRNVRVSHVAGRARVLVPGQELPVLPGKGFGKPVKLPAPSRVRPGKIRANQWNYVDYDGDGKVDLVNGVGDWTDYGWDNAFNARGEWTRGPLHGYVYVLRNTGTNAKPAYAKAEYVQAGGKPVDVYGMPSPCLADFDGDGDLDLLCGEFVDSFTYFQNVGTRKTPRYAAGRKVLEGGQPLRMHLCMIVPVAIDWDRDGDMDLVVGQEDGRVALIEHTGKTADGLPVFRAPRFFRQQADDLKFGALATPVGVDWDSDGDQDIVSGNTAGEIGFIENLSGPGKCPPKWAEPVLLQAGGKTIRIQAGPNGSIQGPCEAKWGYTTISVADWDGDGLLDILANSIWGKVIWFPNVGAKGKPKLAPARPIEVEWTGEQLNAKSPPHPAWNWWKPKGKELVTQWRTTPFATDVNKDGLCDLIMLDHEGYLAFYERKKLSGRLVLLPPKRIFVSPRPTTPLRLNAGQAGRSGRRKLCLADWDRDGTPDLLANSRSIDWHHTLAPPVWSKAGITRPWVLQARGRTAPRRLAGHTTSPTVVDWNGDKVPDLLAGAEDGCFYYLKNPGRAALTPDRKDER